MFKQATTMCIRYQTFLFTFCLYVPVFTCIRADERGRHLQKLPNTHTHTHTHTLPHTHYHTLPPPSSPPPAPHLPSHSFKNAVSWLSVVSGYNSGVTGIDAAVAGSCSSVTRCVPTLPRPPHTHSHTFST